MITSLGGKKCHATDLESLSNVLHILLVKCILKDILSLLRRFISFISGPVLYLSSVLDGLNNISSLFMV